MILKDLMKKHKQEEVSRLGRLSVLNDMMDKVCDTGEHVNVAALAETQRAKLMRMTKDRLIDALANEMDLAIREVHNRITW